MDNQISPKYLMELADRVDKATWEAFSSYKKVQLYIKKWHIVDESYNNYSENFSIARRDSGEIDLLPTLHNMNGETLLKIAIDLGLETPGFISSIPVFRNELKVNFQTASAAFEKAFKQINDHPDVAIGLANSSLESIVKEILSDRRITLQVSDRETLYDLTQKILKAFQFYPESDMPSEIKTMGSSLLSINKSIEDLRSQKTDLHGKTKKDYVIKDPMFSHFVVNAVSTIGLFLISFYKVKFPKEEKIVLANPADIVWEE
ncbi:MAG: abortive infection family protein [Candidatus Omnitrophica bacterium]|nr:abortive infection family protein [Candidatus Omnitrophota bacterium]